MPNPIQPAGAKAAIPMGHALYPEIRGPLCMPSQGKETVAAFPLGVHCCCISAGKLTGLDP